MNCINNHLKDNCNISSMAVKSLFRMQNNSINDMMFFHESNTGITQRHLVMAFQPTQIQSTVLWNQCLELITIKKSIRLFKKENMVFTS